MEFALLMAVVAAEPKVLATLEEQPGLTHDQVVELSRLEGWVFGSLNDAARAKKA